MTTTAMQRLTLDDLRQYKAAGHKFAMLTAYDFQIASLAQAAGVHTLLIGDSMGQVVLGHDTTRHVPLELMLTLGEAVRRGAPRVYLVGDLPFTVMGDDQTALDAAGRFVSEAGCDAVKFEASDKHEGLVRRLSAAGIETMVHLGLRPQSVVSPDGYRAQARDAAGVAGLVDQARRMCAAGAATLLLEAVPAAASQAVVDTVDVPVIGCGAGPACDGHVVVTQDMLGLGGIRPPRFVPVHENLANRIGDALRRWVDEIASGDYPAPQHTYSMRT